MSLLEKVALTNNQIPVCDRILLYYELYWPSLFVSTPRAALAGFMVVASNCASSSPISLHAQSCRWSAKLWLWSEDIP